MAEITVTPAAAASLQDLLASGLGAKYQPFNPLLAQSTPAAPTSQRVFGTAVTAPAGVVLTGVKLRNQQAAAGTLPTTVRFGLADNAGKILALSGNLNALANWVVGPLSFPFTATFTTTYTGIYFPCFVVNGTWSVTQPTPIITSTGAGLPFTADGTNPPPEFGWSGQTDLPAVGASVTLTSAVATVYWIALY